MADDMQWPSEDEDFDTTTDKVPSSVAADDEPEPTPQSASRSVAISTPEDEAEEPQAPDEAAPEPAAEEEEAEPEIEPEQAAEPEAASETAIEPTTQPEELTPGADVKPPKAPKAPKTGKSTGRTILEVILLLVVVGLGLWSWTLYSDNKDLKQQVSQLNNNPQVAVQKQTQALISQVGKLIQLPTDETPTIANVSDAAQAKQQSAFFANAQNGDKVLMYVKAGEAILYRPSTGKIVLVAPLTFTNNASTTTPSTTTTKK